MTPPHMIKGIYSVLYDKGSDRLSFSTVIKDELSRVAYKGECCARAELAAVYFISKAGGAPAGCLVTENAACARRAFNLFRGLGYESPDIVIRKNRKLKKNASYAVQVKTPAAVPEFLAGGGADSGGGAAALRRLARKRCCRKAALRGAFLAGGSIADPEKLYHLEIYCKESGLARYFAGLMADFALNPKVTARLDYSVAYVKDGDKIADFLNITGAHHALMALENTRILKGVRNGVNRAVNCETANVGKTVNASLRQMNSISYIKETIGFDALPKNLREIAALREDNRDISLQELGQFLQPPLGKSGVNHRLRKLDFIAENIRENKDKRRAKR